MLMMQRFLLRPRWSSSSAVWLTVVVAVVALISMTMVVTDAASSCSTNAIYQCPNCDGIEVKDCFDCDGFLSTDMKEKICFNRLLFNRHNTDITDPGNYYHFLWNDIVAAIIWFFIAGFAVSCGVGGGGIFVPLGVLLLQFSPKQAAGLSQCSIFGSTLGGLLLNAQEKHPNEHITDAPGNIITKTGTDDVDMDDVVDGNVGDDGKKVTVVAIQEKLSKSAIESYTGTFYTRPVINYDMVLFLAPMEIAGALMGVIVQTLLPNWLYLICASVVLSLTAYKTFGKYSAARQREKKDEMEQQKKGEGEEMALEDVNVAIHELEQRDGDKNDSQKDTNEASKVMVRQETTGETTVVTSEESGSSNGDASLTGSAGINLSIGVGDGITTGVNGEQNHHQDHNSATWEDTVEMKALRQQYLQDDMRQFPKEKIVGLIVIWLIIFVLTLLRGGKGVPSLVGITCESPWYAVLIVSQFGVLLGAAIYYGLILIRNQNARVQVRYPFQVEDPVWDMKALRFFGSCTFAAGVLAGLIGIGGGMILGPLMLVMGLHPRVSSASTATMIVLTSSSVAVLFVTSGLVPWSYALFYFMMCFLGALINKRQIDAYVKRTGRASLLIFILASIILFATLGCIYNLFSGLAAKDWCLDGFNQFCKVSSSDDECPIDRALSYGVTFLSN